MFYKSIKEIIWTLNVWSGHKHQLQTSVRYIFAKQRDVCYILYEIADNDFIYCIWEWTMFPNRRKKHLVTIFSQGHVLWPYKPMIY